ncbi:MAG: hypothetical protein IPK16_20655 [Anaerolineales bacterium]|nr:hypothetical protein [Anaerolineales bacterium]
MTIVTRTLGASASDLPLIYELAAISGTIVDPEAPVLVRWNTENAQDGVYYAIGDGELQPTGSPGQGIFTFTEDTVFRLYARNQNGEQSLGLWIDVRGQGEGE